MILSLIRTVWGASEIRCGGNRYSLQSIRQFDPQKIAAGTNDSISETCDVLLNLCEFLSYIFHLTTE